MTGRTDKKEYIELLKILDAEASYASTLTKLGKLEIETEDDMLKSHVKNVSDRLRALTGPNVSGKNRLRTLAANFKTHPDAQRKKFGESIEHAWQYGTTMSAKQEPQWMTLARRAGWGPISGQ